MDRTELSNFLSETQFTGYQKISLPSGDVIPGTDRRPLADKIFPESMDGQTILDVGCYYGYFLHEAVRRGASHAMGIEADPERFKAASTLSRLWDGKVQIHSGRLEDYESTERYDYVTFLNVLHHVSDPILVMRKLAALCRGTLVVEFRQPIDDQFLFESFHSPGRTAPKDRSLPGKLVHKARLLGERLIMNEIMKRVPMVGVASVKYHRTYFFSPKAFRNAFQVHEQLFRAIEFRKSLSTGQVLALCDCRPSSRTEPA